MKFTVIVEKWLRGGNGTLLTTTGKMCCLGFAAEQAGVPKEALLGYDLPYDIKSLEYRKLLTAAGLLEGAFDSRFASSAAVINDNSVITDATRMAQLQDLARQHGHEFVFVE